MKRSDSFWFWCIAAVMIVIAGLQAYLIVDGLIRGVAVSHSRVGPSRTYTLVSQPKMYWFTIIWGVIVETMLIVMTLAAAWFAREIDKNERPGKGSRRTRKETGK